MRKENELMVTNLVALVNEKRYDQKGKLIKTYSWSPETISVGIMYIEESKDKKVKPVTNQLLLVELATNNIVAPEQLLERAYFLLLGQMLEELIKESCATE